MEEKEYKKVFSLLPKKLQVYKALWIQRGFQNLCSLPLIVCEQTSHFHTLVSTSTHTFSLFLSLTHTHNHHFFVKIKEIFLVSCLSCLTKRNGAHSMSVVDDIVTLSRIFNCRLKIVSHAGTGATSLCQRAIFRADTISLFMRAKEPSRIVDESQHIQVKAWELG